MNILRKYGLAIAAVVILGCVLYLNRFSSVSNRERGAVLYKENCASCHGDQGEGLRKLIPPLASSTYAATHFNEMPCIIRYGMKGGILVNGKNYDQPMPGIPSLETDEIKAIMDYMIEKWYQEIENPSHAKVASQLENCGN